MQQGSQITGVQSKKLLSLFAGGRTRWSQVCRDLRQAETNGVLKVKELNDTLGTQSCFSAFASILVAALGKLLQPELTQVVTNQDRVCPHSVASYREAYGLICKSAKHSLL